jgi:hypothetical protein
MRQKAHTVQDLVIAATALPEIKDLVPSDSRVVRVAERICRIRRFATLETGRDIHNLSALIAAISQASDSPFASTRRWVQAWVRHHLDGSPPPPRADASKAWAKLNDWDEMGCFFQGSEEGTSMCRHK